MKFNDDKSKIFLKEKYCIIETPVEHAEHSVEVVSKMINMGWTLMSGACLLYTSPSPRDRG